jgi:hypothetical protein
MAPCARKNNRKNTMWLVDAFFLNPEGRKFMGAWRSRALAGLGDSARRLFSAWREFTFCRLYALLPSCALVFGCAMGRAAAPGTAFFYGTPVPVSALSHYERVVVEAENLQDLAALRKAGADVFAYVSVGEAEGWRASSRALPPALFLGANDAWKSRIADLAHPGWQRYLLEDRMAALWAAGYRGFFLDTLDSYLLAARSPAEQQAQRSALVALIRAMHQRFPGVRLMFNRGFEVLPEVGSLAVGLAAESLFQRWNPVTQKYETVSENDRRWLLARLDEARLRYGLPVTVIDYVPADQPELARATARRIVALGFTAWVANPGLDVLSIGVEP